MLIAILCEVIHSAALMEKETCKIQLVKDQLCHIMEESGFSHHIDDDMMITKPQFQMLLLNRSVVDVMRKVGVDAAGLLDFVEYIFSDIDDSHSHGLTFEKLVDLICDLSGSNQATVKDIVDLRQVVTRQLFTMEESIDSQLRSLQTSLPHLSLFHGLRREKTANGGSGCGNRALTEAEYDASSDKEKKDEHCRRLVQTLSPGRAQSASQVKEVAI